MTAVLLACLSAFLFGAMTVALRLALRRCPQAEVATVATVLPALAVAVVAAVADTTRAPLDVTNAWPFLLAGLLAPGASQILFTLAVRDAGPSRTSVAVGVAPLVSVALAVALLGEPAKAALLAGAALVVAGGIALVRDPVRPEHFRVVGLAYALGATVLFASRDNLIRHLSGTAGAARPAVAAAATLVTGALVGVLWWRASGTRSPARAFAAFVPAGICFGLSYVFLFEAYYRSRVTVVSPLVATESLWGVVLSALLLRRTELIGPRLFLGAALVVSGGVLIGAFR